MKEHKVELKCDELKKEVQELITMSENVKRLLFEYNTRCRELAANKHVTVNRKVQELVHFTPIDNIEISCSVQFVNSTTG